MTIEQLNSVPRTVSKLYNCISLSRFNIGHNGLIRPNVWKLLKPITLDVAFSNWNQNLAFIFF